MPYLEYFMAHAAGSYSDSPGLDQLSRGLQEFEGVFLQLRVSREQGPFLWGTPFHQMGFGSEIMLIPYLGQQLSMLLSVSAGG